jgi:hypothetical protein
VWSFGQAARDFTMSGPAFYTYGRHTGGRASFDRIDTLGSAPEHSDRRFDRVPAGVKVERITKWLKESARLRSATVTQSQVQTIAAITAPINQEPKECKAALAAAATPTARMAESEAVQE